MLWSKWEVTRYRELFLNSDGNLLVEGDLFKRPKLAVTLRRIADGGPTTFYTGSLADDVVADIQDVGMWLVSSQLSHVLLVIKFN